MSEHYLESTLFGSDLRIFNFQLVGDQLICELACKRTSSACPVCGKRSRTLHSRYKRILTDLTIVGMRLRLDFCARRFRCRSKSCLRKIFCEQIPNFTRAYGRETERKRSLLANIALALGGRAGERLCRKMNVATSDSTLLRRIRSLNLPEAESTDTVGVDDFAFRRRSRYGTIIVDLKKRKPIDLLPDREAATLEAWLIAHPEIDLLSRDRSLSYKAAMDAAKPDAIQVADRFHLLANATETLQKALEQNHAELKIAAREAEEQLPHLGLATYLPIDTINELKQEPKTREKPGTNAKTECRRERYEKVRVLALENIGIREISRRTHLARNTVRRWLSYDHFPEHRTRNRSSQLDMYRREIAAWFESSNGKGTAADLWRHLQKLGYSGKEGRIRSWLRQNMPRENSGRKAARSYAPKRPWTNVQSATWIFIKPLENHSKEESIFFQSAMKQPQIAQVVHLIRRFGAMVRERAAERLEGWIKEAKSTIISGFAKRLEEDADSIRAALEHEWSQGQVEGQVNRLKFLKRQMYGRAKFDCNYSVGCFTMSFVVIAKIDSLAWQVGSSKRPIDLYRGRRRMEETLS